MKMTHRLSLRKLFAGLNRISLNNSTRKPATFRRGSERENVSEVSRHGPSSLPPTDVYYNPDVFKVMGVMKEEGKFNHYCVSVERIEEGFKAMEYECVEAIEIIFNMFRLRRENFFLNRQSVKTWALSYSLPLQVAY